MYVGHFSIKVPDWTFLLLCASLNETIQFICSLKTYCLLVFTLISCEMYTRFLLYLIFVGLSRFENCFGYWQTRTSRIFFDYLLNFKLKSRKFLAFVKLMLDTISKFGSNECSGRDVTISIIHKQTQLNLVLHLHCIFYRLLTIFISTTASDLYQFTQSLFVLIFRSQTQIYFINVN